MQYKEVVGRRRSIRFFEPDRPVEREKIQVMLEAARLASCAVNAHWLKAIVVHRDKIPEEKLEKLKTPVLNVQLDLAPVHIYFFVDLGVVNRMQGTRLKQLVDVGALPPTHGWSHRFVDELVYPQILKPLTEDAAYPVAAAADAGMAVCQALLAGVDEGLGVGLNTPNPALAKEVFEVPEDWFSLWVLLVGYPAESWDAGGQRPRPDFEEQYFEGSYGKPFKRDPAVVERLKAENMIQRQAVPNDPERRAEIKKLAERLGLPI
ncbi:MAG: nitroreductase family protein [Gammaproteobacteria bacterium]|nr:nitroreductase family protein [Gammaproteobacteria bacterium]